MVLFRRVERIARELAVRCVFDWWPTVGERGAQFFQRRRIMTASPFNYSTLRPGSNINSTVFSNAIDPSSM